MMDMLPFPRLTGATTEEQMKELLNYLIQLKETLEFAFMNISAENLSPDLITRLNELGANIDKNNLLKEDEISQVATNALTVSDVCKSDGFKLAVDDKVTAILGTGGTIMISVNYSTGELEYVATKGE